MPSFLPKIEYCPTKDIDFTPPCTKKKTFDCLSLAQLQERGQQTQQVSVIAPDDNEMSTFLRVPVNVVQTQWYSHFFQSILTDCTQKCTSTLSSTFTISTQTQVNGTSVS